MSELILRKICKAYTAGRNVVSNLNLDVRPGEFVALLGPSGCGKSTLLKIVAGLEMPTSGEVLFDGQVVNKRSPAERNVAMVFQNYALYPHMTVAGNLEYPLRKRGVPKAQRRLDVERVARSLRIEALLDRRPIALSGGQQQRVALGRAMIRNPVVYLFDEPLSNLDASLRAHMRAELINLHNTLGTTTLYVTHDQVEAMTMSSRIAVMDAGRIQQLGTPEEIYHDPANEFVARFVGAPPMNFIETFLGGSERSPELTSRDGAIVLPALNSLTHQASGSIRVGIRPEHVSLGEGPYLGQVVLVETLGHEILATINVGNVQLISRLPAGYRLQRGENIRLNLGAKDLLYFEGDTGERIRISESCLKEAVA